MARWSAVGRNQTPEECQKALLELKSAPMGWEDTVKTHIFIDFWNFQLSINSLATSAYRVDWQKVSPWLVAESSKILGRSLVYEGTRVYISYSSTSKKDAALRDFAINVLSRFASIQVSLVHRKSLSAATCPTCHKPISFCPHCGLPIAGTIEKGVDTAIVTDMLKLASEDA